MNDYDYLNARVRGMSTALLAREFFDQVLSAFTDAMLMDVLLGSAYSADIERARELHADVPVAQAVEAAVWANAGSTFARLLSAAPPRPRLLISLQLNRWDVANVATLVRARQAGAQPHETAAALLPVGELTAGQLGQLAAEQSLEALTEALASWKQPLCIELRRALNERLRQQPGAPARQLERALYEAYFSWALGQLREHDPQERLVRASIRQHIDQLNLLAVLTSIRSRGGATGGATGGSPGESAAPLEPLPRGMLDGKQLAEIAACRTLEDAFEALADTYLGTGVEKGILTYGQSQSLGEMQRFLEAVAVEHACRLFRQDLLGAAVPLGFLWRKYSECVNLRLLARGAIFRMPPDAVRRELLLV